jgi:TIR domain
MAYVPGFDHDLFLSYSHNDSPEWIRALEESLRQQLRERLGHHVDIWQDKNNIRFGQHWSDEIHNGICGSAAFLVVLSPGYRNSDWWARERKIFLDHCKPCPRSCAIRYVSPVSELVTVSPWASSGPCDDSGRPRRKPLESWPRSSVKASRN